MELQKQHRRMYFGDAYVTAGPLPNPIDATTLYIDGSPLNIIEAKQADIRPTTGKRQRRTCGSDEATVGQTFDRMRRAPS